MQPGVAANWSIKSQTEITDERRRQLRPVFKRRSTYNVDYDGGAIAWHGTDDKIPRVCMSVCLSV